LVSFIKKPEINNGTKVRNQEEIRQVGRWTQ